MQDIFQGQRRKHLAGGLALRELQRIQHEHEHLHRQRVGDGLGVAPVARCPRLRVQDLLVQRPQELQIFCIRPAAGSPRQLACGTPSPFVLLLLTCL